MNELPLQRHVIFLERCHSIRDGDAFATPRCFDTLMVVCIVNNSCRYRRLRTATVIEYSRRICPSSTPSRIALSK